MHLDHHRRTLRLRISFTAISTLLFVALWLAGRPAETRGETTVSGTVRDAAGNSIAHAYVEAIPVFAKSNGGTVGSSSPWVAADSAGTFSLSLAPGRYRLRAKAEADGYPDPSFWVNRDLKARFPEIAVFDKQIRNIEVVLGTRGGMLAGEVRDRQTHRSLAGAKIRIQDATNSGAYVEVFSNSNGHFQYTVPSKPLLISAVAPGYKVTSFEGGAEITLSPGGHREFQLDLEHE
jgi:hypothetical protein